MLFTNICENARFNHKGRLACIVAAWFVGVVLFSPTIARGGQDTNVPGYSKEYYSSDAAATSEIDVEALYSDDLFSDDLYADDDWDEGVSDPLESVNRAMFWFNDKSYFYLMKPVARVFRVVPTPVRTGVSRMFDNLKSPLRAVSSLLQLKFVQSGVEISRLLINTTVGLGGFYDPAKNWWGLDKQKEDLGQVLGHYGVGRGWYLVLPLLGPSSVRDGIALLPEFYVDPLYWFLHRDGHWGAIGVDGINTISLDKDTYESIVLEQLDPYLFIRDAYLQQRAGLIAE
ncbi:MAG: VacJ family lipoprotein [Desulfuromonadaceae bacterium]|nr:VacJ family lipoprotein [Desulfuromonas sp.]MDY0185378.1 VacJ family lipoprotein [Desulfuromonadaceae bacterium]